MGWVRKRSGRAGATRYVAVYRDLRGAERSAGTFRTAREAVRAWHRAEEDLAAGRVGDPRRSRQTLATYAETEWFPNHQIEATTRENYRYLLNRYVLPGLGHMRMAELLPHHVREWVVELERTYAARRPTVREAKVVLDAILTTALNDQVVMIHAGRGVKTPPVARKPTRIITVDQYDLIYAGLRDETMRLLVETAIESGLRWGELTELRPADVEMATGRLTVSRAVVELKSTDHEEGRRFVVKDYPKDKEWRQLSLTPRLVERLRGHVAHSGLGPKDLLLAMPPAASTRRRPEQLPDPETLGWTEANGKGRRYRHGTLTAYQAGPCRCQFCKDAVATYRAARRAEDVRTVVRRGRSGPTATSPTAGFRIHVWNPALEAAGLGFRVTPHGLRHAHASWLLAGGVDLQTVRERLGHGSIVTTGKYLHALPGADQAAVRALDAFRGRPQQDATTAADPRDAELAELRQLAGRLQQLLGGTTTTA